MTAATADSNIGRGSSVGRHVFGAAALALGLITLASHDYGGWHQLRYLAYAAVAAQILGGAAMQFRRTEKAGGGVLGAVYLVSALLCVPGIVAAPRIYNNWGNFFEQFCFGGDGLEHFTGERQRDDDDGHKRKERKIRKARRRHDEELLLYIDPERIDVDPGDLLPGEEGDDGRD